MKPFLTRPTIRYRDSFIEAVREFHAEGKLPPWNYTNLLNNFDEFVALIRERALDPPPGYVPQTDYWFIAEGVYAGRISLRHALNESLERFGGHIGYEIRPSMRRRGYGTLQLTLCLEQAWKRGLERVLITCDDDNIGSAKVIEANAGVLQDKIDNEREALTRRYWIERPSP